MFLSRVVAQPALRLVAVLEKLALRYWTLLGRFIRIAMSALKKQSPLRIFWSINSLSMIGSDFCSRRIPDLEIFLVRSSLHRRLIE